MIAKILLREQPHYRKQAFADGLKHAGYTLSTNGLPSSRSDLLIVWNRYGSYEQAADTWERFGGTVIVAENGYVGDKGTVYAISLGQHHAGLGEREPNVDLAPWRPGEFVLVIGQRGIGSKTMASPPGWHSRPFATKRPIKIRPHPGNHAAKVPLEHDLDGAHCCVVWSSGAGVKALAAGVPVFYAAPHWIAQDGALPIGDFEVPQRDDAARVKAFRKVAGSQFSVAEIERGEPFAMIRSLC